MPMFRILLVTAAIAATLLGCGEPKTVIPTTDLTEAEKAAIKAQDEKIANEESHGAKKR